jgi:hypothetical protein
MAMVLSNRAAVAFAAAAACAFTVPAHARLLEHQDLTVAIAITIAQTAIETCKAQGYAVSATVVGRNGEIIVQVRGDNAPPHTLENSFRKAYTAVPPVRWSSASRPIRYSPMSCT